MTIEFRPKLVEASFVERLNRFAALVNVNGKEALAHVPSSGRLKELLLPGAAVWLRPAHAPSRKTAFTLEVVRAQNGTMVSIDTGMTNRLVELALKEKAIPPFSECIKIKPEAAYHLSRLDFRLECRGTETWIEVKSVTLVEGGTALFPDAPTERGRKHLKELERIVSAGGAASVLFLVQRNDAVRFAPNSEQDPDFAQALASARRAGVQILAYSCEVTESEITADFDAELPAFITHGAIT